MDEAKLHDLVGQFLHDLGGAFSIPLVRIGTQLGIYKSMVEEGPATCEKLAKQTGLNERYLREWLSAQAASNYISYDHANKTFCLSPEQAMILANDSSPVYLAPAFETAVAFIDNQDSVQKAFKTGEGVGWGDQSQCLACSVAKFFRPGYKNHIVQEWIPSITGIQEKLKSGAKVADIGCGHGLSTIYMAEAFPKSQFVGFDFHEKSIEDARKHAADHGVTNVSFEVGLAKEYPGKYDFVTFFDCLHDLGDPVGALKHVKDSLNKDGKCMIVEPAAGSNLKENINPVSRLFYCASTMCCVPTSLAQEVGAALGAQAGEAKLKELAVDQAGFKTFRRANETPFNLILEAGI
ncbi:MAG: methyltransferase domain-containing protein [Bdellovibrionales bacterium]|nr:methyltransferase domain-containing protein [Bdellovibrionales bacterium]